MKSIWIILVGLFLAIVLNAGEAEIKCSISLIPISSLGIDIDSVRLILHDADSNEIGEASLTGNTILQSFTGLEAGHYKLTISLYQQGHILCKSISEGYVDAAESKKILCNARMACAYPILQVSWNPGIALDGDDFFNFSIDPDSNYLKRYPLENLGSLAEAFRDSGMHYYNEISVPWGLLDTNLIPMVEYPFGSYRNPVTTCHTAFAFFDEYKEYKDSLSLLGFMNNVNWLVENCDSNYYLHYEFPFDHRTAKLPAGWISGMAQGLALSAISLAYDLTGEQEYLETARGLFTTMHRNSGDHYCIGVDEMDYYWLEEYPSTRFCHVFNGMVAGFWGLWCYYAITRDDFAAVLLEAGIKSVVDNYPQWNYPDADLSYYCLHRSVNQAYHKKHLMQLRYYGDYFGVAEMHQAADCFSNRYFSAYPRSLTMSSDENESRIKVFSTLPWDFESDGRWLDIQHSYPDLLLSCSDNFSNMDRNASIYLHDADSNTLQVVRVTQTGTVVYRIPEISVLRVSKDSGRVWIENKMVSGWTLSSGNPWIETSKINDTLFIIIYPENTMSTYRTANLEVYGEDGLLYHAVKIVQDAYPPSLTVEPDTLWLGSDSGNFQVNVRSSSPWTSTLGDTWLELRQQNDSLLSVSFQGNDNWTERSAIISIRLNDTVNRIIHVSQGAGTSGIFGNPDHAGFKLYPNPASNKIHISIPACETSKLRVIIMGMKGEVIADRQIACQEGHAELDVGKLPAGIYCLRITEPDKVFLGKVTILTK